MNHVQFACCLCIFLFSLGGNEMVIWAANYFDGNNALECTSKQWFYNTLQALQVVIFAAKSGYVTGRKIWGKHRTSIWIHVAWQSPASWLWSTVTCKSSHTETRTWAGTSAQHYAIHSAALGKAQELRRRRSNIALIAFHAATAMIPDGALNKFRQPGSNREWDLVFYLPGHAWPPAGHYRYPAMAVASVQDWQI